MIFANPSFGEIGAVEIDGKILFPAADCARLLKYANPYDAVRRHTKGIVKYEVLTKGGKQKVNFITEGNLYRLIGHSQLPEAEKFESWIFTEVIPSIRLHGMYISESVAREVMETPEEFMARAVAVANETLRKREERIARLEADNAKLCADNKGMAITLDKDEEFLSVRRVAELNGVPASSFDWRKLKRETQKAELGVEHVFASDFGSVNAYHIDAWKAAYPELRYGGGKDGEKRYLVYTLRDGVRSASPLTFLFTAVEEAEDTVKRMKRLNPHIEFELILPE
jgi:prophage antirepressor-like protein